MKPVTSDSSLEPYFFYFLNKTIELKANFYFVFCLNQTASFITSDEKMATTSVMSGLLQE